MPNIATMRESKFLKKEDCDPPVLLTIDGVSQHNVAMRGDPEELKWAISFVEADKPMVLNSTNAQLISAALGSEETDNWIGKKIVLYNDPTISFGGKVIGGIRCRAPKIKAGPAPAAQPLTRAPAAAPAPVPAPVPASLPAAAAAAGGVEEDDVPF